MKNKIIKNLIKFITICIFSIIIATNSFASNTVAGQEMRVRVLYLAGIIDDMTNMNIVVTRAEFAKMLTKASTYKDSVSSIAETSVYSDVPMTNPYASYIKLATSKGYLSGYLGGLFKPDESITYRDLIRGTLALLGYTNDDFTGNQTGGRYEQFCALELNKNISDDKNINDLVLKLDVVNAIYNMLKAKSKTGNDVYGVKVFSMSLNNDGELNASGLLKVNMEGPFIMKRGQTLFQVLPFAPETANYFMNGTASSFSNIQREVSNEGFVIIYYNKATSTVYAYKEGTSVDSTINVKVGYVTHIYYNASDNLTPNSVEIDLARYYLGNTDVKFAFAYAGTLHIGDKIVFIYEKSSSTEGDEDATYVGTLTSAFLFDTMYG